MSLPSFFPSGPLPVKRIAVTLPPADWFHGVTRSLVDIYRQALLDLGLAVFDVPLDAFLPPDAARIETLLSDLRAFRPEMAIGLSHGLHAVNCRLPAGRGGWRRQLFTEVLDIPTICIWDHAPVDISSQLFSHHPETPAGSSDGAIEELRRILTHPRMIHWSRDSGQTRIMRDLGFLRADRLIQEPAPSLPGFFPREAPVQNGASFIGHFYQDPNAYDDPALGALASGSITEWLDTEGLALWDVLVRHTAEMDATLRQTLALDLDQTYFWQFARRLIVHRAQMTNRLKLLGGARVPIRCYGDLNTGAPGVPGNLSAVPGYIQFGPDLAAVMSRHEVTIDVMSPGFVDGYSHKPVLVLASGGFLLMDRKQDFVNAFGAAGEAVSYTGVEGLGGKLEQFLGNPRYRREVGDAIRDQIRRRFTLRKVLHRVILAACGCMENGAAESGPVVQNCDDRTSLPVMDLLPEIQVEYYVPGSSVERSERGMLVTTSPGAWTYSAGFSLPDSVSTMREPHFRLRILVEAGRIGLSAIRTGTALPVAEQLVSPSSQAITVTIELPHDGVNRVILRNTVEGVSRALLIEASLCDRAG